ncbi:NAD(+) synthase [Sporosalibacterium faouarense]|uniref:NAD(+) synthase n=1 Tax=Sporosalibacterium faouarense TaxID=516123 RepID=UPI00192B8EA9|nr:NAD(+) synthase [Sporosalibacterium faouarense]
MKNIEKTVSELVEWLRNNVKNAGCKGIVLGLSGGIDSAVVAALAKKAFPDNTLGVIMPCHSNGKDEEHARLVAEALDLDIIKTDLSEVFDKFLDNVEGNDDHKLAVANIKPRLRMTTLYYYAQSKGYLVAGTGNKAEFTIGYFTKYGDSGVDMFPIADFVKEEVRELAKFLDIPEIIITKPPSAGLWEDQTDENEMGMSYKDLDHYIQTGEGTEEVKQKIEGMKRVSEHKKKFPPAFRR